MEFFSFGFLSLVFFAQMFAKIFWQSLSGSKVENDNTKNE